MDPPINISELQVQFKCRHYKLSDPVRVNVNHEGVLQEKMYYKMGFSILPLPSSYVASIILFGIGLFWDCQMPVSNLNMPWFHLQAYALLEDTVLMQESQDGTSGTNFNRKTWVTHKMTELLTVQVSGVRTYGTLASNIQDMGLDGDCWLGMAQKPASCKPIAKIL